LVAVHGAPVRWRPELPSPARIRSTIATYASTPEDLRELRDFFRALSDATRLRIVQRLCSEPSTVTALAAYVDLSQPLVSWHLRTLRAVGLIETRRSGREVICSISPELEQRYGRHLDELLGRRTSRTERATTPDAADVVVTLGAGEGVVP
jgi:ArsR family transcriptional regulator, zinc-responsive transcriptional repressor